MKFTFTKDAFFDYWPPWIQPDKQVHLLGCAVLFAWFYDNVYACLCGVCAALLTFGCGLAWEIKDGFRENVGFSWRDLVADVLGIFLMWWILL